MAGAFGEHWSYRHINRRTFISRLVAGATASLITGLASAQSAPGARNIVLVHGLFADGSCWSEVIPRLQDKGLNVTAVQNPLTTLEAGVASRRARTDRGLWFQKAAQSGSIRLILPTSR